MTYIVDLIKVLALILLGSIILKIIFEVVIVSTIDYFRVRKAKSKISKSLQSVLETIDNLDIELEEEIDKLINEKIKK